MRKRMDAANDPRSPTSLVVGVVTSRSRSTYDDAGNQLGSTLANCNNLEAGGTWKFEAPVLYDSSAQYKIKDVTGF